MLEAHSIDKSFGRTQALRGVSFAVEAGEVLAVLGENGAGKSTLMKILAGAIAADQGEMRLNGEAYLPGDPGQAQRAGVAMVHQEPQLCPDLTVAENIFLGREARVKGLRHRLWVDRKALHSEAERLTGELIPGGLAGGAWVRALSPGDRQIVAVARALSLDPRVLILDEPTSAMTSAESERLFAAIAQLKGRGIAVLYISHFLEEVERVADRYTVLRDGASVGGGTIGDRPMSEIVELMVGQSVDELFPRSERTPGEVVVELSDLVGAPKPKRASLALRRGEILGIAGLVGSGRTELLRAIFGLDAVRSGRIRVGAATGPASPALRLAQGVGFLSEDRKGEGLLQTMSIADNLTLTRLSGLGPPGWISPARQGKAAQLWVERMHVRCRDVTQPISDLSGGNQQKVALARLLYHEVDVMLLDEPTRGIDVKSRAEIYQQLDSLAAQGTAVLMVSSYLPELFGICDRIAVMQRGTLGEARPVEELEPKAVLAEATGT